MFFLLCLLGHSMNSRTNGITVRWFMQHACGHCQGLHFSHTNLDLVQQTGLSDQRGNNNLSNHVLQRGSEEREEWLTEKTHFLPPTTPPQKRDTTFYELTSKFPLAFFNTPWVRDTAKSQSVLKVRKRTKKKKMSRDNYELAANRLLVQKKTTVHWSMMTRSIPSFSWFVVRRRLTAPLSILSCCDSLLFSLEISIFNSSSWGRKLEMRCQYV